MNGRTVVKECAQKNGKLDENSNDDKEDIDGRSYVVSDDDEIGESSDMDGVVIMGTDIQSDAIDGLDENMNTGSGVISSMLDKGPINRTVPLNIVQSSGSRNSKRPHECFRFCQLLLTYNRQINSVASGFILMLIAGLQIAWGLDVLHEHQGKIIPTIVFLTVLIYYVGAIFGSIAGAFLITYTRKRIIYDFGAVYAFIASLLFLLVGNSSIALCIGRLCAGFLHGLVYITTIIHGAENASKFVRHILLLSFGYNFGLAIVIGVLYRLPLYKDFNREWVVGFQSLVCVIIAVVCTHIFTKESPIFLLQHQRLVYEEDLSEAYDTFSSLQKKDILPEEIERKFDEIKVMLADESLQSHNIFTEGNFKPLTLCICARIVGLLSFNFPLIIKVLESERLITCGHPAIDEIVLNMVLWFSGGMIAICIVHYMNKKYIFYLFSTMFGISCTFICILSIFDVRYSLVFYLPAVLLLFYFYIVSLPLEMVANVYLSEAFTTPKKPFSIALITVIEHFVNILLLLLHFYNFTDCFWLVTSLGLMGFSFKLYWSLPRDTNGISLQQSVYAFRNATAREWYSMANYNSRCVV